MKKISQLKLTKLVKENNLEITRNRKTIKPKVKEPEKKTEKPDLTSGIMVKSAEVVIGMASSLAESVEQVSESAIMLGKIAQEIQKESKVVPVKTAKKRKWKFTPVRDYDKFIKHIIVEEL